MKITLKRCLLALTVFSLIVALFSGFCFVSAAETYNWGTRHTLCTELSEQAQAYYTDSYSYGTLSSLSASSLLSKLRTLITDTHSKTTSYDECKTYAYKTDCQNSDGSVVLLYTSFAAEQGDFNASAPGWNREHVWPKSLGGYSTSGPGADMHHIRPDDVTTNSKRSNQLFGEVTDGVEATGSTLVNNISGGTYDGTYFEPLDNAKGDVARICLYMYVRYGGNSSYSCDDITNVFSDIETLLAWNQLDPVDTWEMGRNDVVEGIQGNRNPFIDYPEYAWLLFDEEIPQDMTTPSNGATNAYSITAESNNTSYGTVSLTNSTITAYPETGYYAAGYTVTAGTATVTQNGNIFSVQPASDCTVCIIFAPKTEVVVTFVQNGAEVSAQSGYSEDIITFPSYTGTVPEGFKFVGWVKDTLAETTNKPEEIYTAGTSYTLTSSETFYALYSKSESDSDGTLAEYAVFTDAIVEGDYVIVYDGGAMLAEESGGRIAYSDVTVVDDAIADPDSAIIWHIAPTSDGYYTIYNESASLYAASTGVKNKATLLSSVDSYAKWSCELTSYGTYEFVNLANSDSGINANLRRNGSYGFACYSTATGNSLSLYQGVTGIVCYMTSATICAHENTQNVDAVEATCSTVGYTEGVYCNDCRCYISGHTLIAVTDHSFDSWVSNDSGYHVKACIYCGDTVTVLCEYESVVTAPTETEKGYTTYTCAVCGYSYDSDYTDALGALQSISFSTPTGVSAPTALTGYVGHTITLPALNDAPAADTYDYKFVGWTDSAVQNSTEKPTVYLAGESYTVTGSTTLYALYTYSVGSADGTGAGTFELLTAAPDSWEGEYVLTNADVSYVFLADGTAPNSTSAAIALENTGITRSGTTLSDVSDNYVIVIEAVGEAYSLRLKGASEECYLMTTNSNSGFNTAASATGKTAQWTITVDSMGSATISNASYTSRAVRFNASSLQFRTYTSGQTDVSLYAGSSATVYYTTVLENATACTHSETSTTTTDATCTEDGSAIVACIECGTVINTMQIPASGHTEIIDEAVAPTCTETGLTEGKHCETCGEILTAQEEIAATGHSYGYTDNGEDHTITCGTCGDCATESHIFTDGVCVCGAVESTEPTYNSALSLTMNISVGAEMQVMYTILNSKVKNYDSFYVEVVKDVVGSDSVTTTFSIANSNLTEVATSAGTVIGYTATYTGIFAMEMGDNFTATLYAVDADGNIYYGDSVTASIKSYLMEKLSDSTSSDELKTLAVDMLNYGAAAQVNFAYDTENLVNADLTDEQKALGTQETPSATDSASASGDASKITTSVSLQSKVLLYVNCAYAKSDDSNLEFVVRNASTGEELERFAPTIAMAKICQGIYGNVGARQMRDLITVELYDNGVLVSQTLTWSIESYVAQVRADSNSSEALIATVNAMLTYGDSAAAYLTASGQ